MRLKILVFSTIVLYNMFLLNLVGQEITNATNAASFLKIGAGAKAISLGGAFVAVADDASAGYWNPAGLAQLHGPVISMADRVPVMDTDYASMAIASPVWSLGFIGLSAIYFGCSDIIAYDEQAVNTGTLTDREAAVILSYAYKLNQLSLGMNAKYIYQDMQSKDIGSSSADGIGADISVLYKIYEKLSVGAVFHSKYNVTSKDDNAISSKSPLSIRAGVHYKIDMGKDNSWNFMADFNQVKSYPLKLHLGTELIFYDFVAIRAGIDDLYAETRNTNTNLMDLLRYNSKPTFGLGFKWKIGKSGTLPEARQKALVFDYAMSIEKLGLKNFFTLSYQF